MKVIVIPNFGEAVDPKKRAETLKKISRAGEVAMAHSKRDPNSLIGKAGIGKFIKARRILVKKMSKPSSKNPNRVSAGLSIDNYAAAGRENRIQAKTYPDVASRQKQLSRLSFGKAKATRKKYPHGHPYRKSLP